MNIVYMDNSIILVSGMKEFDFYFTSKSYLHATDFLYSIEVAISTIKKGKILVDLLRSNGVRANNRFIILEIQDGKIGISKVKESYSLYSLNDKFNLSKETKEMISNVQLNVIGCLNNSALNNAEQFLYTKGVIW